MLEQRSFCSFKLLLLIAQFKFKFLPLRICLVFVPLMSASTIFLINKRSAGVYLCALSTVAGVESPLLIFTVFGGARLYRSMADLL